MAYIQPTNGVETNFLASTPFINFTQETASLTLLPPDSIDPNSATGSQVLNSIYDGDSLLAALAAMATASPGMSAWVVQEEQTISQQIGQELQWLISSSTAPGPPTASNSISSANAAMASAIASAEQVAPGDTQLQQDGTILQATSSTYLSDPSFQNHQAFLAAQGAFLQKMQNDTASAIASDYQSGVNQITSNVLSTVNSLSAPSPSSA
jgi:hypothetical protein